MEPRNILKTSFNLNKELMYSKTIFMNKKAPVKHQVNRYKKNQKI